ncbi:MAG: hypothetical protein HQK53_19905 [Oligoflexia bacterium]|nr:hypothetical protein [Oligoflexia bacterium]
MRKSSIFAFAMSLTMMCFALSLTLFTNNKVYSATENDQYPIDSTISLNSVDDINFPDFIDQIEDVDFQDFTNTATPFQSDLMFNKNAGPLPGIVGYGQINTSTTRGSCGSHAGAVAITYISGLRDNVSASRYIENTIYKRVPILPGEDALKRGYNSYMNERGIRYRAITIGVEEIPTYLGGAAPVVAHLKNHYVTIYGLVSNTVYFSDGSHGYSSSGSWAIGANGYLRAMNWGAFRSKMQGGYIGFWRK